MSNSTPMRPFLTCDHQLESVDVKREVDRWHCKQCNQAGDILKNDDGTCRLVADFEPMFPLNMKKAS